MGDKSMLQELMKDFPEEIRLKLREAVDRTRIQNPNDPIYELMIVLGVWAQYYQSIPASIKAAGESVGRQNYKLHESLDRRVEVLHTIAQEIQAAVDQLEGMPKTIVDQFPSEALAKNIARKIDERFHALPTTKLETELRSLAAAMESVTGKSGQKGLAEKLDKELAGLTGCVERMEKKGYAPDQWPRDVLFTTVGVLLAGIVMMLCVWLFEKPVQQIQPDMSKVDELSALLRKNTFISQYATVQINEKNERVLVVPANRVESATKESDGAIKVILKEL
jgi:hypothetical protein